MRILVVENEIGQEGVDHELLLQQTDKENIILMSNGCICCSVRGDLVATFHALFQKESFSQLDWVVIETTGLADPAPVIQTVYMDKECNKKMRLDSVITVVDAKHIQNHFDMTTSTGNGTGSAKRGGVHGPKSVPEAVQQIAYADRIILNKTDLVTSDELLKVISRINQINPNGVIVTSIQSQVHIEEVLNIYAFDATKNSKLLEDKGFISDSTGNRINITRGIFQIETDAQGKIITNTRKQKKKKSPTVGGEEEVNKRSTSKTGKDKQMDNNFNMSTLYVSIVNTNIYRYRGKYSCCYGKWGRRSIGGGGGGKSRHRGLAAAIYPLPDHMQPTGLESVQQMDGSRVERIWEGFISV
jgi:G3E family GTPase